MYHSFFCKPVLIVLCSILPLCLAAVALLYARSKKRRLKALEAWTRLEEERNRLSRLLQEQEEKMQEARNCLRKQISRDMHDELGNALLALRYYVGNIAERSNSEKERKVLYDIREEVNAVYLQAREYMHSLHREEEEEGGYCITGLLQSMMQLFPPQGRSGIQVEADLQGIARQLSQQQQDQLYLVLKEAIGNVVRHAQASRMSVRLWFNGGSCHFSVVDNGLGFIPAQQQGMGLRNIRSRLESLGGVFKLSSSGEGTELQGHFPL